MDEDFENVFTGEEVKKMTIDLNNLIKQHKEENDKLQQANKQLKDENEEIKQKFAKLQKIIQQNAQTIVNSEIERSKAIEENQILKEYQKKNSLADVINLFKWRCPEESSQLILEQAQKIEELKQNVMKNSNPNNQFGISEYGIFAKDNEIDELKIQVQSYQKALQQFKDSFKEKYFINEVVLTYIENMDAKQDKEKQIIQYLTQVTNFFGDLINQNNIPYSIKIKKNNN